MFHRDVRQTVGDEAPRVVAVCISAGGIPKRPQRLGVVRRDGLAGDGHHHAKHCRPDRAISLWDLELLKQLVAEGFALVPGAAGENLTVAGLNVQSLPPGTLLQIGRVRLRLEQPRRPCYVLDAIHPQLKEAIAGRCGYMASVVRQGVVAPGMLVQIVGVPGKEVDKTEAPPQPALPRVLPDQALLLPPQPHPLQHP